MLRLKLVIAVCLAVTTGRSELFLITGSYNQGWNYASGSKVIRVAANGEVSTGHWLVSADQGFVWVGLSYEARLGAVLVPGESPRIRFFSLQTGSVTKECELPEDYGTPYWADVPGIGAVVQMKHEHWPPQPEADGRLDVIRPAVRIPCTSSFEKAPSANLRYTTALGGGGIGDFVMQDGFRCFAELSGRILHFSRGREDLEIRLPPDAVGENNRLAWLTIRNPEIVVVTLAGEVAEMSRSFVLRRHENRWTELPQEYSAGVKRGFGRYIAVTEAHTKKAVAAQFKDHPGMLNVDQAVRTAEQSAGRGEWRTGSGPDGPNLVESFASSSLLFPGRLHVFDSRTAKDFVLTTNQGDSEVLLIANGVVYYRVSKRLYSVPISDGGLGRSRLMAEDELIDDAHWAFTTR